MMFARSIHRTAVGAVAATAAGAVVALGMIAPATADNGRGHADHAKEHRETRGHSGDQHQHAGDRGRHERADRSRTGNHGQDRAKQPGPGRSHGDARDHANPRGYGHTPVTVCHLRGNGTYIVITFDENALRAHEAHGDLYPVPQGGCPAPAEPETVTPGTEGGDQGGTPTTPGTTIPDEGTTVEQPAVEQPVTSGPTTPAASEGPAVAEGPSVLGVEAMRDRPTASTGTTPEANRAAPALGPIAGVLPQTGAAPVALALTSGLALLVIGAVVLLRRRSLG